MKLSTLLSSLALAMMISLPAWSATDGIKVENLGTGNTFVRVDTDAARYLMIPIQESQDDVPVKIIVNGKDEGTFYVRLANTKVDYTVPFDLTPYRGKKLILDFKAKRGPKLHGDEQKEIGWNTFSLSDEFNTDNTEKYRPAYHHTPLYGWMNDPNGMVYKDGKWHLYYQYNPYGSKWQNMTWGHSVSDDLIHWQQLPNAIEPDALGSIFSGSAAIDRNNTAGFGEDAIVAMYTSAGHSQMQSIAGSTDGGNTFQTYDGNPVITLDTEARDPKIFFNQATGEWNMVLAHALHHGILFFSSPDLKNWTLNSEFGKEGATGGVWECPDFFELEIDGKKKWVLIVNLNPGGPFGGSATQYFIGEYDGKTFTADTDESGEIVTKWMDFGKDHYATVTWSDAPDNRRVALGWMSNWEYANDVPTMQFRSANTLPRDLYLFNGPDGDTYLASAPSPEVLKLRGKTVAKSGKFGVSKAGKAFSLPTSHDGVCEITAMIEAKKGAKVDLTLSNKDGEKVVITYSEADHTLSFDRMHSTFENIHHDFPAITVAPTYETDGRLKLDIFIDRSSIELFGNDGKSVMTNLVFPEAPFTKLTVSGTGSATVSDLNVYEIKL